MPPFRKPTLVTLRRQNPGQAWGFRLGGGAEIGQPFQVQKVTPGSLAYLGGLSEGDELVRIGNISLRGLTHDEVQQIIMRCSLCIDLFVFRDAGGDIAPRFELVNHTEFFSRNQYTPRMQSAPVSPTVRTHQLMFNSFPHPDINQMPPESTMTTLASPGADSRQDFNRSPRPFGGSPVNGFAGSPSQMPAHPLQSQQVQQLAMPVVNTKPGSPVRDTRVFGMSGRGSKSPVCPNAPFDNSVSPIPPTPVAVAPITHQAVIRPSQSIPTTPAASKEFATFFDSNDFNNNPTNGASDKKVFGLPSRGASKTIAPLGNHGVQPVENERKFFGVNPRQRFNSLSFDRHWKESLPIVNIPNTDQLLPSQTKQMQTYINQTPPTEKNLRPSLIGLERRRIRPVWPPPHPGRSHRSGVAIEGRDSPNSKMFNWPPRAQSVDRDFSYGEGPTRYATPPPDRTDPMFRNRVNSATKIWPPPSNATPAGASGYIGDEEDNYAYNPTGEGLPSFVTAHIPPTYRAPPGTQHLTVNDF